MRRETRLTDQRGAIVIHVAIALIALLAFTSFVIDYGIMWVSRRQAQNVADSAALAGAVALLQDGGTATVVNQAALQFASMNPVWGQSNSAANVDVTLSGPSNNIPPCGTTAGCVRVDVYRGTLDRSNNLRGTPIPTFFAKLAGTGQNNQGVRATATAETAQGNSIRCLLPFAVIDRWADNHDENPDGTFFTNDPILDPGITGWSQNDKYMPENGDVYIAPYQNNANHTGWKVATDYGRQLVLKDGRPGNYSAGWANEVDLPNSTGSQDYKWNIENCNEQPVRIAQESEPCTAVDFGRGCVSVKTGVSQGPTSQGIGDLAKGLVGQDPLAAWNWGATGPNGETGAVDGGGGMASPRIRPIVIIDINHYISQGCSGTTCIAKVANIVGFFAEGMCKDVPLDSGVGCDDPNKDVVGRIVTLPGSFVTGVGTVEESASFVNIVRLVR